MTLTALKSNKSNAREKVIIKSPAAFDSITAVAVSTITITITTILCKRTASSNGLPLASL